MQYKSEYCLMDIFMLFPQSCIGVWFFWESRLQHKCTWWLQVLWKFWFLKKKINFEIFSNFRNFQILWKFSNIWNYMKFYENWFFLIFWKISEFSLIRRWSPSVPNKYKTFIQSGRGTKNPRKRFTLPLHSLKNYRPLNSQTTGKGEK